MKKNIFSINIPISFNIIVVEDKINKKNLTIILYNNIYSVTILNIKKKLLCIFYYQCVIHDVDDFNLLIFLSMIKIIFGFKLKLLLKFNLIHLK